MHKTRGFTLIELLVVIGILAVLATTTALILNPAEFLAKSRDSVRVSDLTILNRALRLAELDGASSTALASRVYISLPDIATPADNCATNTGGNAYSLPPLPSGKIYWCVSAANFRSPLGGGWIPVNFTSIPQGSPLAKLPIDPVNSHVNGTYYTYTMGGSWKLTALMEANKHDQSINDGGIFPGVYEIGTNLTLTSPGRDQGLVGYWPMDEGSGTTALDISGFGRFGTLSCSGSGCSIPQWTTGKIGGALSFGDLNTNRALTANFTMGASTSMSYAAWIKPSITYSSTTTPTSAWFYTVTKQNNPFESGYHTWGGYYSIKTYYTSGVDYSAGIPTTLNADTWYHFAGVVSSGKVYLYIDGIEANSTSNAGKPLRDSLSQLSIGSSSAGSNGFKGVIDDVRIYNRALSASEIQAIYNATK